MKIYTKAGDEGKSSIIGGVRIQKSDTIFEVLGTLDELNASLSLLINEFSQLKNAKYLKQLKALLSELVDIQFLIFELGAFVANPKTTIKQTEFLKQDTESLETRMDELDKLLPELKNFVIPGGSEASTAGHFSRAVCRRLERQIMKLKSVKKPAFKNIIRYINRLSDYLFVVSRFANLVSKNKDVLWVKRSK